MKINNKKEIINYIINFATSTNIDIIAHLENVQPSDNLAADLENYLFSNGEMDMAAAKKVATILGISVSDLTHCNEERLDKYLESYDYFNLYKAFLRQLSNKNDKKLLELFCFPMLTELIHAYCEMAADFIVLFTMYVNEGCLYGKFLELFDFLASVLEAHDYVYMGDDLLNEDLVNKFYKIYRDEIQIYNIMEIIIFKTRWIHELWRCVEFTDNPEIISKLDKYAPHWRDYVKSKVGEVLGEEKEICIKGYDCEKVVYLKDNEKAAWAYKVSELVRTGPKYYKTLQERIFDFIFGDDNLRNELRSMYENEQ